MPYEQEQREAIYEIDPIFLKRWSSRAFSDRPVSENVLMSIFEAARWAPSALNIQPWRFIVARKQEDLEKFYSFILPGNLKWSRNAPVLALLISEKTDEISKAFDAGTAWGYLSLEAAHKGLVTHAMGGIDKEKAKEVLNIPDNYDVHIAVAIGYQGDSSELPEDLQKREKPSTRKPFSQIVTEGYFTDSLQS